MNPYRSYSPALLFGLAVLLLAACKKTNNTKITVNNTNPDIYISGTDNGKSAYWKNGTETLLTDNSTESYTTGIAVSANNTIYVSGDEAVNKKNYTAAVCWANGKPDALTDTTQSINSYANSIAVSGNDVYVGGYISTGPDFAAYWKNGTTYQISTANTIGVGVFVSGSDIYLCGDTFLLHGANASYWKNGTLNNLTNVDANFNNGGNANQAFVSGSDVYFAGDTYAQLNGGRHATYWKNGTATVLSASADGGDAFSIFVSRTDVYVCGDKLVNNIYYATYWKNGTEVDLSTSPSVAKAIFVYNNNVYVAGSVFNSLNQLFATYWVNGTPMQFGAANTYCSGIFVK